MSIWQTIKNAFVPWNLLRSGKSEQDSDRTIDYGQLLIDGTSGDISDIARVIERTPSPATTDSAAPTRPASDR